MEFTSPILIHKFTRKAFSVEAVRVTRANTSLVAEWCGATVERDENSKTPFLDMGQGKSKIHHVKRLNTAYPGDWVVKHENIFRVYPKKSFEATFETTPRPEDISGEIRALVREASQSSYHDGNQKSHEERLDEITRKLTGLIRKT